MKHQSEVWIVKSIIRKQQWKKKNEITKVSEIQGYKYEIFSVDQYTNLIAQERGRDISVAISFGKATLYILYLRFGLVSLFNGISTLFRLFNAKS